MYLGKKARLPILFGIGFLLLVLMFTAFSSCRCVHMDYIAYFTHICITVHDADTREPKANEPIYFLDINMDDQRSPHHRLKLGTTDESGRFQDSFYYWWGRDVSLPEIPFMGGGSERSFAIEVGDEGDTEGEVIRARYRFTLGEVRTKERRHQLDDHRVEIGDVFI